MSGLALTSFGQTFTTMATDISGDTNPGDLDAKAVSVAHNVSQDSVWFLIETHNQRSGDYGYVIGINKDNNATNGNDWMGATNNSFKWDILIILSFSSLMQTSPTAFAMTADGNSLGAVNYKLIDGTKTRISIQRSLINTTGSFKFAAGVGSFDIESAGSLDDIPNTGSVAYPAATDINDVGNQSFSLWPNPAKESLQLALADGQYRYRVVDVNGRIQDSGEISVRSGNVCLHVNTFTPGNYTLVLTDERGRQSARLFTKQ